MSELTQERLKELLHYSHQTGIFTWASKPNQRIRIGSTAGWMWNGYISIKIDGCCFLSHRLAWLYMTGKFPENEIDHIDHNKENNSYGNLRCVTRSQNMKNTRIRSDNTSGVTGVTWRKKKNKWQVNINIDGSQVYGGLFECFEDAIIHRKMLENSNNYHQNHGEVK